MPTDQSARDVILGGLLALDHLVPLLDRAYESADESAWSAHAELVHDVVQHLCMRGIKPALTGADRRFLDHLLTGIPRWLCDWTADTTHGLGALMARLDSASARWGALLERITDDGWYFYLEELTAAVVDDPADPHVEPGALAAATSARVEAMVDPDRDLVAYDRSLRLTRTDIALVHWSKTQGVVLGLLISPNIGAATVGVVPPTPDLSAKKWNWNPYLGTFADGVERGRRAALQLLARCRAHADDLRRWDTLRFQVLGALPPVRLEEQSAGLAVAMDILADVTGLPRPGELGVVCTGSVAGTSAESQRFEPATEQSLLCKLAAVHCDRRNGELLYPSPKGFQRRTVNGDTAATGLGLELFDAAQLLWGEQWSGWVDKRRDSTLGEANWRLWIPCKAAIDSAIPIVVTPAAEDVIDRFRGATTPIAVVVGGPANSGTTTTAVCVAEELQGEGWHIVGLAPIDHALPKPGELARVVEIALDTRRPERTLVLLDGLWPTGFRDLGAAVAHVLDDLSVSVLVTARYDNPTREWDLGSLENIPYAADQNWLRDFALQAIKQQPGLARLEPAAAVLAQAAVSDLWLLTQLLPWAAAHVDVPESATEHLRATFIGSRLRHLTAQQRTSLKTLAAASLVNFGVPAADICGAGGGDRDMLLSQGAELIAGTNRWFLRSPVLCRLLLGDDENMQTWRPEHVDQNVVELVNPILRGLLDPDRGSEVIDLLVGCRAFSDLVFVRLVSACGNELVNWADRHRNPTLTAQFLRLAGTELGVSAASALAVTMCVALSTTWLDVGQLGICLRMVNRYRDVIEREDKVFDNFVRNLRDRGLRLALERDASPAAKLGVLRQLERLHHDELDAVIPDHLPDVLRDIDPDRAGDYIVVRRAEELHRRVTGGTHAHRVRTEPPERRAARHDALARPIGEHMPAALRKLAAEPTSKPTDSDQVTPHDDALSGISTRRLQDLPQVRRMLDRRPGSGDGIALFLNALVLRQVFDREQDRRDGDWDNIVNDYREVLQNSLHHSPLGQQARAFGNLGLYNRGLCVSLLNQFELSHQIGAQLPAAQVGDIAFFLRTVTKLNAKFARGLLYDPSDRPKANLVRQFAAKITGADSTAHTAASPRRPNGKGAGMLLHAIVAIDELSGSRRNGFAHALAEELKQEFAEAVLQIDKRASVLAHFLRGLHEADASYLESVTESVERVTVRAIGDSERHWPAQLALELGKDAERGDTFLTDLSAELTRTLRSSAKPMLLDRMRTASSAESLMAYHQLGRALYPALSSEYVDRFDTVTLDKRSRRPVDLLRCCAEIRTTLLLGGVPDAGTRVLDAVEWDGPNDLARIPNPRDLGEALSLLSKIDPERARSDVTTLAQTRHRRGQTDNLTFEVSRALPQPAAAAALLTAIDTAAPGVGSGIVQRLGRESFGAWRAFCTEIAFDQDPRNQALTLLQLVRLGVRPGQPGTARLDNLAVKRWLPTIGATRSPHAIAEVIRMFLAWQPDVAREIAAAVNIDLLAKRLAEGAVTDLRSAWRPLSALALAGRADAAARIAGILADHDPRTVIRACGLHDGAWLVQVLQDAAPQYTGAYIAPLSQLIDTTAAHRHVVDRHQHWLDIGWAAYAVTMCHRGASPTPPKPPVLPDTSTPGASLWGITWLGDQPWIRNTHNRMIDYISRRAAPISPAATVTILTAATRRGGLDKLNGTDWSRMASAPFGTLAALHTIGSADPTARELLRTIRPQVLTRIQHPAARADFHAHRLRQLLIKPTQAAVAGNNLAR